MRTNARAVLGTGGLLLAAVAFACSRTDPLDYPSLLSSSGPTDGGRRVDAGGDGGAADRVPASDAPPPDTSLVDRGSRDAAIDAPLGCTSDVGCDDGIDCTTDLCDLATGVCAHEPLDTSCGTGLSCFSSVGCMPGSFAQNFVTLYGLDLPAGTFAAIGAPGPKFYDIALHPNGTLYGVTEGALYTIDTTTAVPTFVAPVDRALDGLDFGDDGTLYGAAAATTEVYVVDPSSGALTVMAELPSPYSCSGDVAVLGSTLYVTATDGSSSPDVLMSVALTGTATVTTLGSTGHHCVYGLAAYEGLLYGFTCEGNVLSIDTSVGYSTILEENPGETFYGATSR